jgi:hypothetical protein
MNSSVKVARMGSSTAVKDDTTCYITGEGLVVNSGGMKYRIEQPEGKRLQMF